MEIIEEAKSKINLSLNLTGKKENNFYQLLSFICFSNFSDQLILPVGFDQNKDIENKDLNTKFGLYNEKCGFNNLLFWGHDEVMYISLIQSKHRLL